MNKKKIFILILIFLLIAIVVTFSILYSKNLTVRVFFDEYIFRKNIAQIIDIEIVQNN